MTASDEITKVPTRRVLQNGFLRAIRFIYLFCLAAWSSTVYCMILRKTFTHEAFMKAVKSLVFIDFSKFYISGLIAWSPDKTRLYDFPTQMVWVHNVLGPLDHPPDSIPYTPIFCVLMRVFTWMPIEKALLVAFITIFSAAVFAITKILVDKGHLTKSECVLFCILAMTPIGVVEIFQLGQSTFFWLLTMSTFYGCFLKRKDILAGVAIAFLALKPQYAVLASASLIGCKRWKILIAAAITESILLLIATAVVGVDTMVYYPKFLHWAAGHVTTFIPNHNPSLGMITLRGLLAPFVPEELNYHICSIISLAVWVPLVFVWYKCNKLGTEALSWAAAITVACTIFFSAHSLIYDFMLVSICWVITLKTGELSGKFAPGDKLKRLWIGIFWLIPGFTWMVSALQTGYEFSARTHALILLTVICVASANLIKIFKLAKQTSVADQPAL